MRSEESISVVIPTYNRAVDLVKAIESVLGQTHPAAEILVCDDGSTDGSEQLVSKIFNGKVSWINCGRSGRPAIPRNVGIRKASSQWIAFLDSDDTWLPNKLGTQLAFAGRRHLKAVCTNGWKHAAGKPAELFFADGGDQEISFEQMVEFNRVICSSMVCRKEVLEKCGLFPEHKTVRAVEDYILWLRIAAATKIGYIAEPLLNYTDIPSQSIRLEWTDSVSQRRHIFSYLKRHKAYFSKDQLLHLYEKFKRMYKPKFWQRLDFEKWLTL